MAQLTGDVFQSFLEFNDPGIIEELTGSRATVSSNNEHVVTTLKDITDEFAQTRLREKTRQLAEQESHKSYSFSDFTNIITEVVRGSQYVWEAICVVFHFCWDLLKLLARRIAGQIKDCFIACKNAVSYVIGRVVTCVGGWVRALSKALSIGTLINSIFTFSTGGNK
ncbi:uncharacterized protein LOC131940070 [Physella acuta]|uniref:uncharacterized protein LOC131940070 n=1 Tax=Physella acuta TaxID=109671 RepID=UPI0027DAE0DA|nr:uncharacterized protein LOC131940070 [Physella acuta]